LSSLKTISIDKVDFSTDEEEEEHQVELFVRPISPAPLINLQTEQGDPSGFSAVEPYTAEAFRI